MKELCQKLYSPLYETLTLQAAGLIVGLLLVLTHAAALLREPVLRTKLKALPRSQNAGTILLTIAFIWGYVVATCIDLGDFERLRWLAQFACPVIYVAMLFWVNDYLGARSLGILLLLAACPPLDAAWLKTDSRWVLNLVCYVWLTLGMFWVGMPYTLRDQIGWVLKSPGRYKALALAGIGYGAVLIVMSFTAWKGL
jgi:multisubunit Na+/H+ antiporter MnhG subunit